MQKLKRERSDVALHPERSHSEADGISPVEEGTFELYLTHERNEGDAILRIFGGNFEQVVTIAGTTTRQRRTYPGAIIAVTVFENYVNKLIAAGFQRKAQAPSPHADIESLIDDALDEPTGYLLLAEALCAAGEPRGELIEIDAALLGSEDPSLLERRAALLGKHSKRFFGVLDDLKRSLPDTFTYAHEFGFVREACVADADAVALADGFESTLLHVDPHELGFDPLVERPANHTYAVHALRRLLEHPSARFLRRLRLTVHAELEPLLSLLASYGRTDRVSHLTLTSKSAPVLGHVVPDIVALACHAGHHGRLLSAPLLHLKHLTLRGEPAGSHPSLAAIDARNLPALRHLALWDMPLDARSTRALLEQPILEQLDSLDLWSQVTPQRAFLEELLAHRDGLAHLERLVLPVHGSPELVALFSDWRSVVFADRRRTGLEQDDSEAIAGFPIGGYSF